MSAGRDKDDPGQHAAAFGISKADPFCGLSRSFNRHGIGHLFFWRLVFVHRTVYIKISILFAELRFRGEYPRTDDLSFNFDLNRFDAQSRFEALIL